MSVLNRSMFQRPMPIVKRSIGSSQLGEIQNTIIENDPLYTTGKRAFPRGKRALSETETNRNLPSNYDKMKQSIKDIYDDMFSSPDEEIITEETITPSLSIEQIMAKRNEIIGVLNRRVEELSLSPEKAAEIINSITGGGEPDLGLINQLYEDIVISDQEFKKFIENRAEGSPMQGEQVNAENVGIMDGFSGEGQGEEAEAMAILEEGQRAEKEIEGTETYDELMRSIRGDDLSEADRREELASYVGEKDAEETPDSVLTLVQPVMQMLDQDTANTGIGQIEEGQEMATIAPTQQDAEEMMAMNMTQQPVGVANGGYMSGFPNQNMGTQSLTASDNIDNRIMQNLQFERMAPGMMGYANGGQVQHFYLGGEGIAGKKAIYDPLYMELMEGFNDPERNKGNTLTDISRLALAYGRGDIDPSEAGSMFLDSTQKRVNTQGDKEKALEMQLKSGSLSSAIAAQTAEDLAASNLRTAMAKKTGESGITYFKEEGAEVPLEFADISGLVEKIDGLPNGSTVFVDKNNKSTITLPKVENKEAYYDTRATQKKVVFLSDEEINAMEDTSFLTTVGAGLTFVKIKRVNDENEEEILDINLSELQKYLNENKGWEVVPDSQISIKKEEGIQLNAGGPVRKRNEGTPKEGEIVGDKSLEYYEDILDNAEEAMKGGKIFVAQTDADRSFFNSLYTSAYDGLNELQTLKKLIAEDPNLVGYTGVFKQTLNKVAGFINDMENLMGDKIFPDDGSTVFGQGMQFLTAPEIADVKSSVEQLSDAVADIMSLRGKRGTPESVRKRAEKRTDVVSMDQRQIVFNKIDKLTDFMIDKTKLFGIVSGNYDDETYPAFKDSMEKLRINLKNINPENFAEKKTTFTIQELQNILGE